MPTTANLQRVCLADGVSGASLGADTTLSRLIYDPDAQTRQTHSNAW
jgi:hypothetical protein